MDENGKLVPKGKNDVSLGYISWCLTTPIAHLPSLPADCFSKEKRYYRYAVFAPSCWILASNGRDWKPDLDISEYVGDSLL